jgi:hypothetical protein
MSLDDIEDKLRTLVSRIEKRVQEKETQVIDAEIEAMVAYRILGDSSITLDYLAGLQSASDLVRYGVHLSDVSQ